MKLLLDTHLLLRAAGDVPRLSVAAQKLFGDPQNELLFSAASLWEVAIKSGLKRNDFSVDPRLLRHELLKHDYSEIQITGEHVVAVVDLPTHHQDPFDRLLVAQAFVEGITLVTADRQLKKYPGTIRFV